MQSQLKEIKKILDLPELKIVKSTYTRWLAYEFCVKAVKASYSSIVLALENIYETSHEPDALELSRALCSHSTIAAMYLCLTDQAPGHLPYFLSSGCYS